MGTKLAPREFQRALEVLGRELEESRPTRVQRRVYRVLNWSAVSFVTGYFLLFLGMLSPVVLGIGLAVVMISVVVMAGAFLLNLGLARKLRRIARTRRSLGLTEALETAFKEQRRKRPLRNLATACLTVIGSILFILTVIFLFAKWRSQDWSELEDFISFSLGALLFAISGLSLASIHFIRRGMERLGIVQRLYDYLRSSKAADESGASKIEVPDYAYDLLAKMERSQIIQKRQESLRRAAENPDLFGYAIHTSFAAQDARSKLSEHERTLVDAEILRFSRNPSLDGDRVSFDEKSGLHRLKVEDTDVTVLFHIDQSARRLRILRIDSSATATTKEEGHVG